MHPDHSLGIVHIVDSLEFGGLERVVTDLAISQNQAGHRVSVFSISATEGLRPVLEAAGVPVLVGGKQGTLDLRVLRMLRAHVSGNRLDIVHTHNFVPNYYAAAALLGTRRHVLVNTCHNMGSRLSNRRLRWLYRWSLRRTAKVAMVGGQVHDRLVADRIVDAANAVTVLNGIPVQRFADLPADQPLRARALLGIAQDDQVLGCVGRLVPLKNHRLLLSCLPRLLVLHPRLKAVLIGEGPLREELLAYARSLGVEAQVVFAGAHADVATLLPALDVFALPSRTEGLSIALLEACAAGLPIVATAVGGNPEIISDGVTGRLIANEDAEALCSVLDGLLADPAERERLGAGARDWVKENGSVESMQQNYSALYASALGSKRRPASAGSTR